MNSFLQTAPAIHLANINLSYQKKPLFCEFTLEIPAGKCLCLLGPSGVGKTTILRLIAGLITGADSNFSATITASDSLPLSNRIAYMSQQDLLMPWLTVLENVLIGFKLRTNNKQLKKNMAEQALFLLKKVGLENVATYKPNILSGGMRQRVALARTLIENKPIVLMDEPFASLDAITRLRLQDLTTELLTNRTVLLVTHDPLEALRLADIIYVLKGVPVKLSDPIIPQGIAPRAPSNSELLKLEAKLFSELTEAHEESIS